MADLVSPENRSKNMAAIKTRIRSLKYILGKGCLHWDYDTEKMYYLLGRV